MSAALPESFTSAADRQSASVRFALPLSTRAALATLLARHRVLIVPGWNNSGARHWQTLWQNEFPSIRRVEQREWANPDPDEWVATLDAAVRAEKKPAILVAHSLGCITVARWAEAQRDAANGTWPVAGALLVAPADIERPTAHSALKSFAPVAISRLPFAARLVASSNDPCCSEVRARDLARQWGAGFSLVEGGGHINADSGLGFWPQGLSLLAWMSGHTSVTGRES